MNKNKLVIIFVIFLSFLSLGHWCYRSFYSPNEDEKVEEAEGSFIPKYEVKDIPEIARKDFFLFCQQLDDYEQKAIDEKKIRQEDLEKSIEILKDQGIWGTLPVESSIGVDFETYYSSIQDSRKAFQLQLNELLKKAKKEEDLENFYEELEKLGEERKKDIDAFVEFAQRIQKEAKKPMPFFATYIGLEISIAICLLISIYISFQKTNEETDWKKKRSKCLYLFLIIYSLSQFLIFPLINCLLSLKISSFKETYKHYIFNKFKLFSLAFFPIVWGCILQFYWFNKKEHLEKESPEIVSEIMMNAERRMKKKGKKVKKEKINKKKNNRNNEKEN